MRTSEFNPSRIMLGALIGAGWIMTIVALLRSTGAL